MGGIVLHTSQGSATPNRSSVDVAIEPESYRGMIAIGDAAAARAAASKP
jgi:hypothetical protein